MKTKSAETRHDEPRVECEDKQQARPVRQWESFPQPADCSAKWDFEALSRPPRMADHGDDEQQPKPTKQWESFPEPADTSVKWDFEGLSQPPRVTSREEADRFRAAPSTTGEA